MTSFLVSTNTYKKTPSTHYGTPTVHNYIENDDAYGPTHMANCIVDQVLILLRVSHFCNSVIDPSAGDILEYRYLIRGPDKAIWRTSLANDLGRLAQGVGTRMKSGTNTIVFVQQSAVLSDRKVSYVHLVASMRPKKAETHRVRVTAGGDRLEYPGVTSTNTASLITTKCLLNSVISIPNAKFMTAYIKNFYYGTPLSHFEYIRMALDDVPTEIVALHNLHSLSTNGWIYMEIRKAMTGLKQVGKVANDLLITHLDQYGYSPCAQTPVLWRHKTRPVMFTLCFDDFGIKYVDCKDVDHLLNTLRDLYTITCD